VTASYTNATWRNMTSWAYPEASYAMRREIWEVHRRYHQGLMWALGNDARIPVHIRTEMMNWGLCADEFHETNGWCVKRAPHPRELGHRARPRCTPG
jgi:hypothetical protein